MGCTNSEDKGHMVGDLCSPCHGWITKRTSDHRQSQAHKNESLPMAGHVIVGEDNDGAID